MIMLIGMALYRWGVFTGRCRTSVYAILLALGILIGSLIVGRLMGTRLLDILWRSVVDRDASPAAPDVAAAIRERRTPAPSE